MFCPNKQLEFGIQMGKKRYNDINRRKHIVEIVKKYLQDIYNSNYKEMIMNQQKCKEM